MGSPSSTWSCRPRIRTSSSAPTTCGPKRPVCWPKSARPPGSTWCPIRAAPPSTARRSPFRSRTRWVEAGRCRRSSWTSTFRSEVGAASGLDLVPDPGGAAFYGPKISVQVKDALGRSWQMSTIQLDFNFPERFDLTYTAADGSRQRPVMIHRALFGSIERFFGILTEHYAGAFPAWLAPVQVVGIPVADDHVPYLNGLATQLKMHGIRAEVDASDDRMAKKIVNHTNEKV